MNPNSEEFHRFLHDLGVEMEPLSHQTPSSPSQEEEIMQTIMQRSRDHEAFYRLDLIRLRVPPSGCPHMVPQLRIVLPESQGRLKFHVYLIQLSEHHPLSAIFDQWSGYQGSQVFEHERDVAIWHLLNAVGETMKGLFWANEEVAQFPTEITVTKLI